MGAQLGHGAAHGPAGAQFHEFRRHDAPGGVLRVFEQLVDGAARARVGLGQDAPDNARGHLLDKIGGVVGAQRGHDRAQLFVRQLLDQALLRFGCEFGKQRGGLVLGAQAEQHGALFRAQVLEHGGQVGRGQRLQHIAQALVLFGVVQVRQHGLEGLDGGVGHKKTASFSGGSCPFIKQNAQRRATLRPGPAQRDGSPPPGRPAHGKSRRLPSGYFVVQVYWGYPTSTTSRV